MKKVVVLLSLGFVLGTYGCSSNEKKAEVETQPQQENAAIGETLDDPELDVEAEQTNPDYAFGASDELIENEKFVNEANDTEEEASDPSLGAGSSGRGH